MFDPWSGGSPSAADAFSWWSDLYLKTLGAMTSFAPDAQPPEALRQMRSAMLQAWTEHWDRFLRSPEFLRPLKQMTDANVQFRRQMGNLFGEFQHQLQNVSRQDVDQVMRSLQHVEQRLADAIERISDRLDELDERIEDRGRSASERPAREEPAGDRGNGRGGSRGTRRARRRSV